MHTDYVIFFLTALFAVVGAGLFRVGLMNFKSETSEYARKGWLFIALGNVEGSEDGRLGLREPAIRASYRLLGGLDRAGTQATLA